MVDKKEVKSTIKKLEPYIDHKKSCPIRSTTSVTNPTGEYCTCDVDEIVEEVDSVLRQL